MLASYLHMRDVPFRIEFTRPFGAKEVLELGLEGKKKFFVFLDQGSKEVSLIHKSILGKGHEVAILDHHQGESLEHPDFAHFNPHLLGLNGAKEVCASSVAFSVVERIEKSLRPLVWLALVGAIGDRQEFSTGFIGVNRILAKRGSDLGFVEMREGIKLVGRETLPAVECLGLSIGPYLPGLSGNPEACSSLLESLGVSPSSKLGELGPEKEKELADAIFERISSTPNEALYRMLWGPLYFARRTGLPGLREWVLTLEACGAQDKPELGFAANIGDEGARETCSAILRNHQRRMLLGMGWLTRHLDSFEVTPNVRYIHAGEGVRAAEVGELLSLGIESGILEADRPLLGIAEIDELEVKVSGRITFELAERGTNVGSAMTEAAKAVGGEGGGHDVSGAAYIPRERVRDFILEIDRCFANQVKS